MAIGDSFGASSNENNTRKLYETPYYPRMKLKKDNTALMFEFRGGLLIVKILAVGADGFSMDIDNPKGLIYLSPTKSLQLAKEIRVFKEYLNSGKIDPNKAFGVNGGMGEKISFIAFHADKDKNITVTIGKFDGNGAIIESADTKLNKDYHYSLEWNNLKAMDVTRVFNNELELDQLLYLFEDFGRFMNGASAYSYADLTRFDTVRILNKMDPIYDKLGIERLSGRQGGFKPRQDNNFLSNTGTSESKSYESIQSMFED